MGRAGLVALALTLASPASAWDVYDEAGGCYLVVRASEAGPGPDSDDVLLYVRTTPQAPEISLTTLSGLPFDDETSGTLRAGEFKAVLWFRDGWGWTPDAGADVAMLEAFATAEEARLEVRFSGGQRLGARFESEELLFDEMPAEIWRHLPPKEFMERFA